VRPFPKLSEAIARVRQTGRPLKICVVTSEILGPVRNGGIGTATSRLVEHLSDNGHQVTVLFTSVEHGVPACDEKDWSYWVADLARRDLELAHIQHEGDYRMWRRKSWLAKEFLAERDFDVVCFNEHHGSAYYTLAAKRAGLPSFAQRIHCVFTHGSIEWVMNTNEQYISRSSDLEMIGLERRSVEWADVVIGPSEYLLREYQSYGWRLPEQTFVQPYAFQGAGVEPSAALVDVCELVFFGRLESRKGVWLFCDALDRLAERLRGHVVTFMGRTTDVGGVPSVAIILERAARWPFQVKLLTRFNQTEALDYLSSPGRLAVMPSVADNSPCVVYECMANRIPFVATSGSGTDELVHTDCWDKVMVEPTVRALSDRLHDILDHGAKLAWPRFDADENLRVWSAWGDWLGFQLDEASASTPTGESTPLVGQRMLLVTIDSPDATLGGLSSRVALHMARFGTSLRHAVLTPRLGRARELLSEALTASDFASDVDLRIFGADSIPSVIDSINSADIVFFTDAEHEILSTFFVSAVVTMVQQRAAGVSCVAGERRSSEAPLEVAELPCGDLPAAGGLGLPIGSSVWGARTRDLIGTLAEDDFCRPETGELVEATALGQALLHKLIVAGKEVLLLPQVGAVRTRVVWEGPRRRYWYREAEETARRLGVEPFVFSGGAGWLGINVAQSIDGREATADQDPSPSPALNSILQTGRTLKDLAAFSAALGRPDQAVRLCAGRDNNLQTADTLLNIARRASEARERLDLLSMLVRQPPGSSEPPFGNRSMPPKPQQDFRTRLMAALARRTAAYDRGQDVGHPPSAQEMANWPFVAERVSDPLYSSGSSVTSQVHFDAVHVEWSADHDGVRLRSSHLAHSGRLTFMDVMLAGHERLVLEVSSKQPLHVRLGIDVIEQVTGGTIAEAAAPMLPRGPSRLVADLRGIFGAVSVSLVFEARNAAFPTSLDIGLNRLMID
jgi:glycosyltransferase involved in cell wall biosynthesis